MTVVNRCGVVEEYSSSIRYGVDPKLSILDAGVVNSMLVIKNGVELIPAVAGFKSVVLVKAVIPVDANAVESRGVGVDSTASKRCGVVEEYISSTRYGVDDPWLLILDVEVDVVVSRLLMIEEVVKLDSLIVEGRLVRRLVMRKGVEPKSRVVGFKSTVLVDAIISVDANSVVVVDPRDLVVDSTVSKRCGVIEEYVS